MKFYAILPFVLQALAYPIAHLIFRVNGTFTVHGYENIKNIKGPIIVASNHQNQLDPIVQRASLRLISQFTPLFWVARAKNTYDWQGWRSILFGDWFFRSWGAYPAYKGFNDYKKSLKHQIKILNDGHSVSVYPQGGKGIKKSVEETQLFDVHGGVVFLSQETGTPIVPIFIKGTLGINAEKLFLKKTKIDMYILPPVFFNKNEVIDYKDQAQLVMDQIYAAVEEK